MPARLDIGRLSDRIGRGVRVFLPGSAGEPTALLDLWFDDPERTRDADIVTSFVPGINRVPAERFHPSARLSGVFPHSGSRSGDTLPRIDTIPLSYFGFARALRRSLGIGCIVVQVAPPDEAGMCCLGPTAEFLPVLAMSNVRMLGIVNANVPRLSGGIAIPMDRFDAWCDADTPLRTIDQGGADPVSLAIAHHIADWIDDGAVLQLGIGKVPLALPELIKDRRGLRFHSGLVSEGLRVLAEAGSLTGEKASIGCAALGGTDFYEWLATRNDVLLRGCEITHDPARLAEIEGLIAINSAIEVDLTGQANLEKIGRRTVSAAGGAPDFAHAASHSDTGLSIVALPATGSGRSRIVRSLAAGAPVGIQRQCVDVVITEHGSADLRGLSASARRDTLLAIADPAFHAELSMPSA